MKRLKYYLLNMEKNNNTYKNIYEGEMVEPSRPPEVEFTQYYYDSTYWKDGIAYTFERTHKLALDKPTVTIQIPTEKMKISNYDVISADYCLRSFKPFIKEINQLYYNRRRPDKENGKFYIYSPSGEVLKRNTSYFKLMNQKYYENGKKNIVYILDNDYKNCNTKMCLCMKIQVQLPYKKHRNSIKMLTRDLPYAVNGFIDNFDNKALIDAIELNKKQLAIRSWLKNSNYCAFIANGSILPRSKNNQQPLQNAIPFKSPKDNQIEIYGIKGMGIKKGVTVITGGGYSGKSTLLDAISSGIYDHIKGDGREFVITDNSAVKISAEDGRSVKNVNISPFIKWVTNQDVTNFSTEHASGSTSQAANIMEAINGGTKLLLIDEDKSATNFMIRDNMMKELVEKEPIIPFTDRVNQLYEKNGVSTILVIGGSGEYLSVANKIYIMEDFIISNVTNKAKKISKKYNNLIEKPQTVDWIKKRKLITNKFTSYPESSGTERLEVSDMGFILIGDERIDIRMLHNIVSITQLNAIAFIIRYIEISNNDNIIDIENKVNDVFDKIEKEGLDCIFSNFFTTCDRFLDLPRECDVIAVINRMRKITFSQEKR